MCQKVYFYFPTYIMGQIKNVELFLARSLVFMVKKKNSAFSKQILTNLEMLPLFYEDINTYNSREKKSIKKYFCEYTKKIQNTGQSFELLKCLIIVHRR